MGQQYLGDICKGNTVATIGAAVLVGAGEHVYVAAAAQHVDEVRAVRVKLLLRAVDERVVRGCGPVKQVVEGGGLARHAACVRLRHDLTRG